MNLDLYHNRTNGVCQEHLATKVETGKFSILNIQDIKLYLMAFQDADREH